MTRFQARHVLVTGAARGIGSAVALRLASEGARVRILDRDAAALEETVARIRGATQAGEVNGEAVDITDAGQVNAAVARANAEQPVSVLVNNAGVIRDGWAHRLSDDDWNTVLAVNLTGAFHCCRAVIPAMKDAGYGRIVNVASRAWLGNPGQVNYVASKAGLVGLTRGLALELVRFGITVNAVAPGLIDTPMVQGLDPAVRERLTKAQPGGRMGTPEEVAAAIAFLACDEAGFITGQVLHVCGGKSVGLAGT